MKDVALHLLDGDLSRLSRGRDSDSTGVVSKGDNNPDFTEMLAAKNQRWIEAARHLSGRVIQDLLGYSTAALEEWTAAADLLRPSTVSWAATNPCPPGSTSLAN